MPKNITIDELAEMVKQGFDHMDQRFDRIEQFILADHQRRIERIEEALAMPSQRR